jgi:uncharacterized membrane protein
MTDQIDFDAPLSRQDVEKLYRDGKLPRAAIQFLLQKIEPRTPWGKWADRLALVVGATLILAGVVFFFAYNWAQMPGWQKLGLVNLGLITSISVAIWRGFDDLIGQIFTIAASFFVGVYMAVFGQIYQTGADAYQLFMMWSLLILPWVVITRSLAHWAMWLVIFCLYLGFYWVQALGDGVEILVVLGGTVLAAHFIQNLAAKRMVWARGNWFSWATMFVAVGYLCSMADLWFFKLRYGYTIAYDPFEGRYFDIAGLAAIASLFLAYFGAFHWFKNIVSAQILTLGLCLLVAAAYIIFFGEIIFDFDESGLVFGGLFSAAIIAGIFWAGIQFVNWHDFSNTPRREGDNA